MSLTDINFQKIVSNLESWANFENSSKLKDISKLESIQLLLSKLDNPEKNFRIESGCPDPGCADAENGWTDLSGKADEIQTDAGSDGQFLYPGRFRNSYAKS